MESRLCSQLVNHGNMDMHVMHTHIQRERERERELGGGGHPMNGNAQDVYRCTLCLCVVMYI